MEGENIIVKDLYKVYRLGKLEVPALRGLNMEVNAGEIVVIMGPSGSGKSTLLNCIGGLDQPTAGKITVGNIDVTNLDSRQLNEFRRTYVGHIFQTQNLIPTLTARENIELPMIAAGTPRSKRRERSEMLLNVVGLTERGNHKPDELSGGERQRIALATALANDPPLLLGDEPTGELDSVNSKIIVDFLLKVNREFGKTVLIVSHDSSVARECRRILRIEDGVITSQYTPAQLVEEGTSLGYVDQIRSRITDIDARLLELDEDFKRSRVDGDGYVERRLSLKNTRSALQDELGRMGN